MSEGGHALDRGDCFGTRQNRQFMKIKDRERGEEQVRERHCGGLRKQEDYLVNSGLTQEQELKAK